MMDLWIRLGPVGIEKKGKGKIKMLSSALLINKCVLKLDKEKVLLSKRRVVEKAQRRQL